MSEIPPTTVGKTQRPAPARQKGISSSRLFSQRVTALAVDAVVLFYIYLTGRAVLLSLPVFKQQKIDKPDLMQLAIPIALVLGIAIALALLWGSLTTSLGMRASNLRMVREGRPAPLTRRLLQFLVSLVAFVPAFLGLAALDALSSTLGYAALGTLPLLVIVLWMLWDPRHQTLADKAAGVQVLAEERVQRDVRVKPRRFYTRSWGVIALVALVLSYVTGWIITKIDLTMLVTRVGDAKPLLVDLLHPDLFERKAVNQIAHADFQIPCTGTPPGPVQAKPGQPSLVITSASTCGVVGDVVRIRGTGFLANAEGLLLWADPIGDEQRIRQIVVDPDGTFVYTLQVPVARTAEGEVSQIRVEIAQHTGPWQATGTLLLVIDKMIETVFLALMATTLGIIIALPLSFLGARNLMGKGAVGRTVYYATRFILNVLRAIEPLIWGLIFVVWVGIGPFAGVLALTLHSVASLAKLYSEAIEGIDPGPIEAITATGASRLQTIMFAVIPQMIPPFISFTIYRWDINVRMSTVVGFVGGGGVGFLLIQWINLLQYRQAATAVWAIALVVAVMDYASAIVREKVV